MKPTPQQLSDFSSLMKARRKTSGLTAQDVVFKLYDVGVKSSVQSISSWENGRYVPSDRATVAALDAVLNADGQLLALLDYGGDSLDERLTEMEAQIESIKNLVADIGARLESVSRAGRTRKSTGSESQ